MTRTGILMLAVMVWAAGLAAGDAAKARKKLDDAYIPFTPQEFCSRVDRRDMKIIALFLEAGIDVNAAGDRGRTPLHVAAGLDDGVKLMPLLLKAGARLDAKDD